MSKKHPSELEARWRANYRYRRMRTVWLEEAASGDPLRLVEDMRKAGALAATQHAIMATAVVPPTPSQHEAQGDDQHGRTHRD